MNNIIKKYILWGFFFIYPITCAFIPKINLGFIILNPFRLYLLFPILYLFDIFFKNSGRIKISKESTFMFSYVIFTLFNSFRANDFSATSVINFFFPLLFIILFENLEYEKGDFVFFYRVLSILVVIVFLVSLLQNFVDYKIYSGIIKKSFSETKYLAFGDTFRNASIFGAIDFYQAGMAMGMLCVIFMFLNFEKIKLKYLIFCFMMLISTFLTYTRSNWIIPIIAFTLFVYFKPFEKKIWLLILIFLGE